MSLTAFFIGLNSTVMSHGLHHVTQAGAWPVGVPGQTRLQPTLHSGNSETTGTQIKKHVSCRQPLSTISKHKLNTGHQCSLRDVQMLNLEENWHRRKIKETINIYGEAITKQRHCPETLAGQAPASVTWCRSCDTTVKFSPLNVFMIITMVPDLCPYSNHLFVFQVTWVNCKKNMVTESTSWKVVYNVLPLLMVFNAF